MGIIGNKVQKKIDDNIFTNYWTKPGFCEKIKYTFNYTRSY